MLNPISFFNIFKNESNSLNPDYLTYANDIFTQANNERVQFDASNPKFPNFATEYNFDDIQIQQCSAVEDNIWNNIKGIWEDIKDGKSKDGEIGDTSQGATGDCWLLSGVNALSYTEEGRKAISQALDYKDGYTVVHTACGDYVVSNQEVRLTKADAQYSDGDDDMIIFELAIEKIIDDYANGRISIEEDAHWLLKGALEDAPTTSGHSSTGGGWQAACMYFITGKMSQVESDKAKMQDLLDKFEANGKKDLALAATIRTEESYLPIKDVNGNEVKLPGGHAYSIKNYKGGNVTVVNPWDSSKEIVLPVDEFFKVFYHIQACDLSENNPKEDYFSPKMYYNKYGNIEKMIGVDDNGYSYQYQYNYDKNGDLLDINYDANDSRGNYLKYIWDADGNLSRAENGNKDTNVSLIRCYDEEGKEQKVLFGETDSRGNLKYTFSEMTFELADKILDNNLMQYKSLDAQDIFKLVKKLSDSELDKAVDYLKQNPSATYGDILEAIK